MLLGGIPALGSVISAIFGISTEGMIAAILVSAIGGGAGGMAVYFTRSLRKKSSWAFYLAFIIVMEAYIIIVTLCIFVVVILCPYLRDEIFENTFSRGFFHLGLHIYGLFLVTICVGIVSLQKFIRKRRVGNLNITKFPSQKDEQ